jgi:hypothetical protein
MNGIFALLGSASFFYPIYWLSMFLVRAGPVLLHVAFLRHRLLSFEFGPLWVEAACCPPGAFVVHEGFPAAAPLETLVVFAAAAVAFFAVRKHRIIAGSLIASLGQIALAGPLLGLLFARRHGAGIVLAACLYAALVLLGLTLLSSSVNGGYWKRFAAPALGFCLPLAILSSFYLRLGADWQIIAIFAAPPFLFAAIAALWNRPPACSSDLPRAVPLLRLATGLAATLVFAAAIHAAQIARDHSQHAARQAFLSGVPKTPSNAAYPKIFFQRGVNLTAEGPVGYDPSSIAPLLDQLKSYGVDSIALVPYGFADSKQPTVRFPGGMERTEDIEALTALAHQRGMKVLLKPQLWTRGGFPGNLAFPDAGRRAHWFTEYRKFVEYYAAAAARMHADLFSVGVELAKMTPYEAEWRALITRARELYPGPLVYSAVQGPEFETIRFWDALDYIGLNEYYPLPDSLSTADLVRTVETVQKKFARPVIFTEAGFCSYSQPHRAPWDETPRALAPADQARCYDAVFKAFYSKPWFQGVYWWKVGSDGFGGPDDGSHTPWGKTAMDVVRHWYRSGGR